MLGRDQLFNKGYKVFLKLFIYLFIYLLFNCYYTRNNPAEIQNLFYNGVL